MPSEKIKSFINLRAWQEAHKLVLLVYRSSAKFPKNAYSLIDQIRRAVISISSLTEVQNLLLVSKDIKYLDQAEFKIIAEQTIVVHKLINGLIRSIKNSNSLDTKY